MSSKCICGSDVCTLTWKTQENHGHPLFRCETMKDEVWFGEFRHHCWIFA
ncbi:unnamed protein product [Brassica rapa]|uniref:Uncharacterized protein n=1 Tax=Brassica campestris TaxID=3711 RepID=A0A8D9GVP7_BRACM|nr:unnamed protein product [Brassica rapa]